MSPAVLRSRSVGQSCTGQATVEFAIAGVVFFFLVVGIVSIGWFVFEASVATDAARAAARWSISVANGATNTGSVTGQPPACDLTTDPELAQIAAKAAGPFASDISSGAVSAAMAPSPSSGVTGCQVTVKLPYSVFAGLFQFGPPVITGSATAYYTYTS